MEIHSNNVVRSSAGEQIRDQRARLGHPLPVADHGLKGRGLRRRLTREARIDRAAMGAVFWGAEVAGLVRLVRVERVAALEPVPVGLGRAAGRVRRGAGRHALFQLHLHELVVEVRRAIGQAGALGLRRMRRLRARVERVRARPRARSRRLCEGRARLVVRDVRLARVGEEGQDGGDALRGSCAACRDGDEKSGRQSDTHQTR